MLLFSPSARDDLDSSYSYSSSSSYGSRYDLSNSNSNITNPSVYYPSSTSSASSPLRQQSHRVYPTTTTAPTSSTMRSDTHPPSRRHLGQGHGQNQNQNLHWPPRFDSSPQPPQTFASNSYYHPSPSLRTAPSNAMDLNNLPPGTLINYPDPSDFDYAAFLHATDNANHANHPHASATSAPGYPLVPSLAHTPQPPTPLPIFSDSSRVGTSPGSDHNGGGSSSHNVRASSVGSGDMTRSSGGSSAAKQRLERRGHTKSRRGCYNCKRRRIKCQETRPACGHCVKTGLKCEYPSMPQITHQPHHQIPLFSLQDMRFFQHFLTQCYPATPLGQEHVWTHEIPCIAHNHEFLMHAILGFAASELLSTDPTLVTAAMAHRVKAIKAIKKRLAEASKMNTSYEEANALVATCFALTFQSVSLDDGLAEYLTFIRGIVIVAMQMMFRNIRPMFDNLMGSEQEAALAPVMEGLPLIQKGWADMAAEAINGLRPLCMEQVELDYHQKLTNIVDKLYVNSFDAWKANSSAYSWWMLLPHASFQELINSDNQTMTLLHAHYLALTQIMTFITDQQYTLRSVEPSRSSSTGMDSSHSDRGTTADAADNPGFHRWLRHLNASVDYEHQMYNQWPVWVDEQLRKDPGFFGKSIK
ncbi:fungal zn(2)-Cys(6) binuclear cluster domain-containing protein [Sarocladium implicatum]|nr:fungal zn(2)-Cys(6) binuclear cluster domain-containing protein [Sarocladium implicatum]